MDSRIYKAVCYGAILMAGVSAGLRIAAIYIEQVAKYEPAWWRIWVSVGVACIFVYLRETLSERGIAVRGTVGTPSPGLYQLQPSMVDDVLQQIGVTPENVKLYALEIHPDNPLGVTVVRDGETVGEIAVSWIWEAEDGEIRKLKKPEGSDNG